MTHTRARERKQASRTAWEAHDDVDDYTPSDGEQSDGEPALEDLSLDEEVTTHSTRASKFTKKETKKITKPSEVTAEEIKYIIRVRDNLEDPEATGPLSYAKTQRKYNEEWGKNSSEGGINNLYKRHRAAYVADHPGYPENIKEYYEAKEEEDGELYVPDTPLPRNNKSREDGAVSDKQKEHRERSEMHVQIRITDETGVEVDPVYVPLQHLLAEAVNIAQQLRKPGDDFAVLKVTTKAIDCPAVARCIQCISPIPLVALPHRDICLAIDGESGDEELSAEDIEWNIDNLASFMTAALTLGLNHPYNLAVDHIRKLLQENSENLKDHEPAHEKFEIADIDPDCLEKWWKVSLSTNAAGDFLLDIFEAHGHSVIGNLMKSNSMPLLDFQSRLMSRMAKEQPDPVATMDNAVWCKAYHIHGPEEESCRLFTMKELDPTDGYLLAIEDRLKHQSLQQRPVTIPGDANIPATKQLEPYDLASFLRIREEAGKI